MNDFTPQQIVVLFVEILNRRQHIQIAQEKIEEAFSSLPGAQQAYLSPQFGAYLSVFLRQEKHLQIIQRKIEKLLNGASPTMVR